MHQPCLGRYPFIIVLKDVGQWSPPGFRHGFSSVSSWAKNQMMISGLNLGWAAADVNDFLSGIYWMIENGLWYISDTDRPRIWYACARKLNKAPKWEFNGGCWWSLGIARGIPKFPRKNAWHLRPPLYLNFLTTTCKWVQQVQFWSNHRKLIAYLPVARNYDFAH